VINVKLLVRRIVGGVVPEMVQEEGQLSDLESCAYRGLPKSAAYCAPKLRFLRSSKVASRLERGDDVTIIHPGFIKTS